MILVSDLVRVGEISTFLLLEDCDLLYQVRVSVLTHICQKESKGHLAEVRKYSRFQKTSDITFNTYQMPREGVTRRGAGPFLDQQNSDHQF